jgi:hypothetical protein
VGSVDTSDAAARNALDHLFSALRGKVCWSITGGGAAGSHIKLEFGERIPRRIPVRNPVLTAEERKFEGEYSLFIECAWRVEIGDSVFASSAGFEALEARALMTTLTCLIGSVVTGTLISAPVPDAVLVFSESITLRIFCDQIEEGSDNYSLRVGDTIVIVGSHGKLSTEKRKAE